MQETYFGNAKTILLECKNHTFGMQLINENEEISKLV